MKSLSRFKEKSIQVTSINRPNEGKELMIYLSASEAAVSAVLTRSEGSRHLLVYYVNKVMSRPETSYTLIEKLDSILFMLAQKLSL